jgi:hypothetical protein
MHVDDVGSNRDVYGHRHTEANAGGKNAQVAVRQLGVEDGLTHGNPETGILAPCDGAVQEAPVSSAMPNSPLVSAAATSSDVAP